MRFSIECATEEGKPDPLRRIQHHLDAKHVELRQANPRGFLDQFEQQLEIILEEVADKIGMKVDTHTEMNGALVARFYPKYLSKFPGND